MRRVQEQSDRSRSPLPRRRGGHPAFDAIRPKGGRLLDPVGIIQVRGDVDIASTPRLVDALRTAWHEGGETVVLDLSESTFLDSSALNALLNAHRRLIEAGRRLVIACPSGPIRTVMEVMHLNEVLDIRPTLEAALAAESRWG